jgi:hypothetical protein
LDIFAWGHNKSLQQVVVQERVWGVEGILQKRVWKNQHRSNGHEVVT